MEKKNCHILSKFIVWDKLGHILAISVHNIIHTLYMHPCSLDISGGDTIVRSLFIYQNIPSSKQSKPQSCKQRFPFIISCFLSLGESLKTTKYPRESSSDSSVKILIYTQILPPPSCRFFMDLTHLQLGIGIITNIEWTIFILMR